MRRRTWLLVISAVVIVGAGAAAVYATRDSTTNYSVAGVASCLPTLSMHDVSTDKADFDYIAQSADAGLITSIDGNGLQLLDGDGTLNDAYDSVPGGVTTHRYGNLLAVWDTDPSADAQHILEACLAESRR
jgi:hypothetical protein